jgi:peptidoglycan hydrolase CwlO-like protein
MFQANLQARMTAIGSTASTITQSPSVLPIQTPSERMYVANMNNMQSDIERLSGQLTEIQSSVSVHTKQNAELQHELNAANNTIQSLENTVQRYEMWWQQVDMF